MSETACDMNAKGRGIEIATEVIVVNETEGGMSGMIAGMTGMVVEEEDLAEMIVTREKIVSSGLWAMMRGTVAGIRTEVTEIEIEGDIRSCLMLNLNCSCRFLTENKSIEKTIFVV